MSFEDNATDRGIAVKLMCERKLVPCHPKSLYRLLNKKQSGGLTLDTEWNGRGRPRLFDSRMLENVAEEMQKENGRAYGKKEINNMLIEQRNKLIQNAGHTLLDTSETIKRTTLSTCVAELAMMGAHSLTQTAIAKTNNRFAAEHSIRGSVSLLMLVAVTHFIPVIAEDSDVRKDLQKLPAET